MKDRPSSHAKQQLDKVIQKARIHFYKPIWIAEILFHHRQNPFDLSEVENYRNISKKWRDQVTLRLVGRQSTSSQKYQDNLFEDNAIPAELLNLLGEINLAQGGVVESYIYHAFQDRLSDLRVAYEYLKGPAENFSLAAFLSLFSDKAGLRRSIDKAYEIVSFALFSGLLPELNLSIQLQAPPITTEGLAEIRYLLTGLQKNESELRPAVNLYRLGVTNAADRGLDILSSWGILIQVKHLDLSYELVQQISQNLPPSHYLLVCRLADAGLKSEILQAFWPNLRGIVTQEDLETWYQVCKEHYPDRFIKLLSGLRHEFATEFPMLENLEPFMKERNYENPRPWLI
jgi:type II restriction enzyme